MRRALAGWVPTGWVSTVWVPTGRVPAKARCRQIAAVVQVRASQASSSDSAWPEVPTDECPPFCPAARRSGRRRRATAAPPAKGRRRCTSSLDRAWRFRGTPRRRSVRRPGWSSDWWARPRPQARRARSSPSSWLPGRGPVHCPQRQDSRSPQRTLWTRRRIPSGLAFVPSVSFVVKPSSPTSSARRLHRSTLVDQHLARLAAGGGRHDPLHLHHVDEPCRAAEPDAKAPLQVGDRRLAAL